MLEAPDYSNHAITRSSVKKLDDAKIQLEQAYFKEQQNYAQGEVDEIRAAADHQKSKIVWETVNEFTGTKETMVELKQKALRNASKSGKTNS